MKYIERTVSNKLNRLLKSFPVVLVVGARQVGKTTLVKSLNRNYIVFDDITQLNAALNDPDEYINSIKKPVTIDEIQKLPALLPVIKKYVDIHLKPGDFILTGSANVLNLKNNTETLAGRLSEIILFPFSCKEKNQKHNENPIEIILSDINALESTYRSDNIFKYILEGGYPFPSFTKKSMERFEWFNSYISTYIERDVRAIGELRDIDTFIKFYSVIMTRSANILNKSDIANMTRCNIATIENYISLLQKIYQIYLLKPFYSNIEKRFIKMPKIFVTDSGLLCHLLGVRTKQDLLRSPYKGAIFETFIFSELLKHINYSTKIITINFYRTHDYKEIDFILQSHEKKIAIEVKASSTVESDDFRAIIDFQKTIDPTTIGIVIYTGNNTVKFSKNLYAIPVGFLL